MAVRSAPKESDPSPRTMRTFKVCFLEEDSYRSSESEEEGDQGCGENAGSAPRLSPLRLSDVASIYLEQFLQEEAKKEAARMSARLDEDFESASVEPAGVSPGSFPSRTVDAIAKEQLEALRKRQDSRNRRLRGLESALKSEHHQVDTELARRIKQQEEEAARAAAQAAKLAAEKAEKSKVEVAAAEIEARKENERREALQKAEKERRDREAAALADKEKQEAQQKLEKKVSGTGMGTLSQEKGMYCGMPALEFEALCSSALKQLREVALPVTSATDNASRRIRRNIDRKLGTFISQISGTQEQVIRKAGEIISTLELLKAEGAAFHSFGVLTLCKRFISQVAAQVPQLPSFAFPVAEVAAEVCGRCTEILLPFLGTLHEACPLTVPKLPKYVKSVYKDEQAFYRACGYRFLDTAEDGAGGHPEPTDDYTRRLKGFVGFYGAFTQVSNPRNTHGLSFAWMWTSRTLNYLPATRVVGAALHAFLATAGYAMALEYGKQFQKLLLLIESDFLPKLGASKEDGAGAAHMRLTAYISRQEWKSPPEGRALPRTDASSLTINEF